VSDGREPSPADGAGDEAPADGERNGADIAEAASAGAAAPADEPGPGWTLREARERLGVSEREVAEALNLPPQVIEAMEADDASKLPGAVFARGYLRSYAKLLELDAEALLDHYPKPAEDPEIGDLAPLPARPWWQDNALWPFRGLIAGALVVLLLLVWLWPDGTDSAADTVASRAPAAGEVPALRPSEAPATDVQARRPDAPSDAAATVAGPLPDAAPRPVPASAPGSAAAPTAAATAEVPAQPLADGAQRLTATGSDRLSLSFSEDCWVEVRAADGTSLYSDLNRGGASLALVGEAPFRVLLGYAPGVRLEFNGEAVPLAPHTRNNVATLVLGQ